MEAGTDIARVGQSVPGLVFPAVTLETKCWEADWRSVLDAARLRRIADGLSFAFTERVVFINNVADPDAVCRLAERRVAEGLLTGFERVADHADAALEMAGLTREELGRGYVYSAAELVGIHRCRTPFLLHLASDVMPAPASDEAGHWIMDALALFARDARIKVANPVWNGRFGEAHMEALEETEAFFLGHGFSDQCYLVRTEDWQGAIYGETHPEPGRYPDYGGELFEKRADAWLRRHGYLRATHRRTAYAHPDLL